jgi:uncharacterized protein with GYD domain
MSTEEVSMATFVILVNLTEQGARNFKESPNRAEAFQAAAAKAGVQVKSLFWTAGAYDVVVTVEGPEEAVMATNAMMASLGNVRTQTLRAFNAAEMKKIISLMP